MSFADMANEDENDLSEKGYCHLRVVICHSKWNALQTEKWMWYINYTDCMYVFVILCVCMQIY